jgi:hypothetical protein
MNSRAFTFKLGRVTLPLLLLGFPAHSTSGQQKLQIAPAKKSDSYAVEENGRRIRVQQGELARGNFQIAGVDLERDGEGVLKQAARVLGPAKTRATGDAALSDERACYQSLDSNDQTRLYFHEGEVAFWFVLSSEAPTSERGDVCRPSRKITRDIATASGLRLGQTEEQVIAILGLPTRRSHNTKTGHEFMAYEYETKKSAGPDELARARREHPDMNEDQLMVNDYGYYDLGESIRARFTNRLLTELTVSWVATT